jgi:hypothetical protein
MQEGRRFNGPAAWRYRIGGTGKEISMLCTHCKERFSNLFQRYLMNTKKPPFAFSRLWF